MDNVLSAHPAIWAAQARSFTRPHVPLCAVHTAGVARWGGSYTVMTIFPRARPSS
jgi:hypothetical protein